MATVTDVARDAAYPKALVVYFDGRPTDDELRTLHDRAKLRLPFSVHPDDCTMIASGGGAGGAAMTASAPLSQAMIDVFDERRRQIAVEGWTPAHDDTHEPGSLSRAAAAYAMPSFFREARYNAHDTFLSVLWPFEWHWWKPKNARADKVRAAALIIADIEAMDRKAVLDQARAS